MRGERKIRSAGGIAAQTAAVACALLLAGGGPANRVNYVTISVTPPHELIAQRMDDDNFAGALEIIERELVRSPNDPWLSYNATCALAQLGETDRAGAMLLEAIKGGYRRFSWIQRDPDLRPIRETPRYRALLEARAAADSALASRRINDWRQRLTDGRFRHDSHDRYPIDYLTCLDESDQTEAKRMVAAQIDRLKSMFGDWPTQRVLIVLAEPRDGFSLLQRTHVGGVYRHEGREVIVLDADMTLRHELAHVAHNFHMDAVNQQHPVWIQEGLATLFEAEIDSSDFTNPRQNQAKSLLREHDLMPWRELFALSEEAFNAQAHRLYPQVMSMFRFIAVERDVAAWYSTYVDGFNEDASGAHALEAVFELPLPEVESRWRAWLAAQPIVAGGIGRSVVGNPHSESKAAPIILARPEQGRRAPLVRFKPAAAKCHTGPTIDGG